MENYIVSARKYRPETFQTVIGQPSITTTLKNAIQSKQLAHAYLFCGPRGVGKTTCARIFAKTINCFNITANTEACNECESCLSFNSSRSFNIHELDAASNNSVDDIRTLIEQVRIPPQVAKYSIYIIDEVHMLSPNAFNAFLKTLEEPPAHAIFILATTEKHKIIPTILSRCQIYDFHRIKIDDIVSHLENIAKAENIKAESEGLNIIAQKADGAMRDALSIFDQLVSFSAGQITYQNVIDNLNVLDYDYYFRLTEAILSGNIPASLMIFNEVLENGFDGHNFVNGLSRHFRDLLVCRDEITLQLLEVGAAIREKYKNQSKSCSHDFIFNALSVTNQCDISFRSSKNQRLHVELCLVQLCGLATGEKKKSEPGADRLKKEKKEPAKGPETAAAQNDPATESTQKDPATESTQKDPATESTQNDPATESTQNDPATESTQKDPATESTQNDPATESTQKDPAATTTQGDQSPAEDKTPDSETKTPSSAPVLSTASAVSNKKQADTGEIVNLDLPARAGKSPVSNDNNTISIKDVLKGTISAPVAETANDLFEGIDDDDPLTVNEETDDFTEKELMEQWKKFANQIRNKHPRLYNTLLANKPSINSQTSIEFEINNPLQKEALNKIKPELVNHLRRELNQKLELIITINETLQGSRLYLPEDKFEHMVKKNPDLAILKQKFNLDFE